MGREQREEEGREREKKYDYDEDDDDPVVGGGGGKGKVGELSAVGPSSKEEEVGGVDNIVYRNGNGGS